MSYFSTLRYALAVLRDDPSYFSQAVSNRFAMRSCLRSLAKSKNFDLIIDVGSNRGSFIRAVRCYFPDIKIIAFEPIEECADYLEKEFGNHNCTIIRKAVGKNIGMTKFYLNNHIDSSSVLKTSTNHDQVFAFSKKQVSINVPLDSLDNQLGKTRCNSGLLKLDIQGFEDRALSGSKTVLKRISVIICEVNFIEMYLKQSSFDSIYSIIKPYGFAFSGMIDIIKNPSSGQVISGDALFIKE